MYLFEGLSIYTIRTRYARLHDVINILFDTWFDIAFSLISGIVCSLVLYGVWNMTKYSIQYVYLTWLQSSTRKPQWFQCLQLEIPNVTSWSVFQNQVTHVHI